MTVNIAIIGLGQVGTSIGLALGKHVNQVRRIGHDKNLEAAQKAREMGALDSVQVNLPAAARQADLVILAMPIQEIEETLKIIAPDLREDAVVVDTCPLKAPVAQWFKQIVPAGRHYVGLVPAVSPNHIMDISSQPHELLFAGGLIGVAAPEGAPGAAIKLAADLVNLLGAETFFMDIPEADSLMTTVHLLPQYMAATLLNITVNQPGWPEARRLAGRAYAAGTVAAVSQDDPEALKFGALASKEITLRVLDTALAALTGLRDLVAEGNEDELGKRLSQAEAGRMSWWRERQTGNWQEVEMGKAKLPPKSGFLTRLFGFGGKVK